MISVEEALAQVKEAAQPLSPIEVPLGNAVGMTLAESVVSDIDSPPYTKSLVDGFAVRAEDVHGEVQLDVVEEVTAGAVPTKPVGVGEATRIMTGAPMPEGADAVVMVEQTEEKERKVLIRTACSSGDNVLPQAKVMREGEDLLQAGALIRPIEVGLMAEVGHARVRVYPKPRVAILSTGNELVEPSVKPNPGQIRNSNGSMLAAQVIQTGAEAVPLGIAEDDFESMVRAANRGLMADVFVLSGGVSAGVLDLVPRVLQECGVRCIFHKVNLKPGKPIWFGMTEAPNPTLVFGLPGNPVSGLVCFELFVRPAIAKLAHHAFERDVLRGKLTVAHRRRGPRPTYFPSACHRTDAGWEITPVPWKGSADQRSLVAANGLAHMPPGDYDYEPGEEIEFSLI